MRPNDDRIAFFIPWFGCDARQWGYWKTLKRDWDLSFGSFGNAVSRDGGGYCEALATRGSADVL
jgi:hypothetical protein